MGARSTHASRRHWPRLWALPPSSMEAADGPAAYRRSLTALACPFGLGCAAGGPSVLLEGVLQLLSFPGVGLKLRLQLHSLGVGFELANLWPLLSLISRLRSRRIRASVSLLRSLRLRVVEGSPSQTGALDRLANGTLTPTYAPGGLRILIQGVPGTPTPPFSSLNSAI